MHPEKHSISNVGWLRAAVLGANDGLISTASLIVGVAAASSSMNEVVVAGVAGIVAGAMSMAAGEYVSVSSQADSEQADLAREKRELADMPEHELEELTQIYQSRGLSRDLAEKVAQQLTEKDALGAHARDELGITEHGLARPVQAAIVSALTFAVGAALPLIIAVLTPFALVTKAVFAGSLIGLALLGGLGAKIGGAPMLKAALRVAFWGVFAMAATAAIGALVGRAV